MSAIEASTELTRNGVAAAVLSRLADDERIGNDAAARAVRWLTLGGAVLAGQVPDAAQVAAMIDDIATLVADELGADSNILTI